MYPCLCTPGGLLYRWLDLLLYPWRIGIPLRDWHRHSLRSQTWRPPPCTPYGCRLLPHQCTVGSLLYPGHQVAVPLADRLLYPGPPGVLGTSCCTPIRQQGGRVVGAALNRRLGVFPVGTAGGSRQMMLAVGNALDSRVGGEGCTRQQAGGIARGCCNGTIFGAALDSKVGDGSAVESKLVALPRVLRWTAGWVGRAGSSRQHAGGVARKAALDSR